MKKIITVLALWSILLTSYASPYTFYKTPKKEAEIAFKLETLNNIVPIYFAKHQWIKVGNRQNGQIGWIQHKNLHNLMSSSTQYHQRFHHKNQNKKGSLQSENIFEYIGPRPITQAQADKMVLRMQKRQQHMHQNMTRMMQHMNNMFADMEEDMWALMPHPKHKHDNPSKLTSNKQQPDKKFTKAKKAN